MALSCSASFLAFGRGCISRAHYCSRGCRLISCVGRIYWSGRSLSISRRWTGSALCAAPAPSGSVTTSRTSGQSRRSRYVETRFFPTLLRVCATDSASRYYTIRIHAHAMQAQTMFTPLSYHVICKPLQAMLHGPGGASQQQSASTDWMRHGCYASLFEEFPTGRYVCMYVCIYIYATPPPHVPTLCA